jgi:uncharacterized RDD family membrane protein YckC
MKIIELNVMLSLIMLIFVSMVMILTRYNQRFGDLLARTAVIDAASLPRGDQTMVQSQTGDNQPADPASPPPMPPKPDKDDESDRGAGQQ